MSSASQSIEILLALPDGCHRTLVACRPDETVGDLVARSGFDRLCHEQTGHYPAAYGIYGRRVSAEQRPQAGDRIELLRPLEIDPRAARRARVAKKNAVD